MDLSDSLWHMSGFGREEHTGHQPYWWVNCLRGQDFRAVLQYTLAGVLHFHHKGRQHRVVTGQAVLFDQNDKSEYGICADDPNYRCVWIGFKGAGVEQHCGLLREQYGSIIDDGHKRLFLSMEQLIKTANPVTEPNPLITAPLVYRFFLRFMRMHEDERVVKPVDSAVEQLMANPLYPWSMKEIAHANGCSREHLVRVFSETYGMGPAAWLNARRLEHAVSLLKQTGLPVAAVAEQSGFASAHTMARLMREEFGQGPRALRQ